MYRIILYQYIDNENVEFFGGLMNNVLKIEFYIINNDKFLINFVQKDIPVPISIFSDEVKSFNDYIIIEDFIVNSKNKSIKLIGEFDSKYTINRKSIEELTKGVEELNLEKQ